MTPARIAQAAHGDRLALIVECVPRDDAVGAERLGGLRQQFVALVAGSRLNTGFGLLAVPAGDAMRNAKLGRERRNGFGFGGGFRP